MVTGAEPALDSGVGTRRSAAAPRGFVPTLTVVCGLLLGAIVIGQVSHLAAGPHPPGLLDFPSAAAVMFTLVGALVVPRQPHNPIGWLFTAIGLSSAFVVLGTSFSGFHLMAWVAAWLPAVAYGLLPLALLVFPNGRLPSRFWRPVKWAAVVCLSLAAVGLSVAAWADPSLSIHSHDVPLGRMIALGVARVALVGVIVSIIAAVGSLAVRWRRTNGDTRQQLKWLGVGAGFIPVGIVLQLFDVPGAWVLVAATVPTAAAVAILRYRLYDIDLFLNRSLVYATLTLLVVATYTGIVTLLGTVFHAGTKWQQVVATGAIAMAFGPLRERVQRGANRLLYGDRNDPYAVISRLGRRLAQAVDPAEVLPQVTETVSDALQLPFAAIELTEGADGERLVASYGRRMGEPDAFAMTYQGQVVGRLLVNPRSPSQPFTSAERSLLEDLARQAGLTAHAVGLTADLQRSRERLVRSREEERRRLRRDLHDGLGPTMAGMIMQVGAARALLTNNADQAEGVLGQLEQQMQSCIREIRQLIDNLRPASLDNLGLIGSIRHHIGAFTADSGGSIVHITVTAADNLGELPAAVEVAAYRIVTEAITNTVRHAAASHCDVRLTIQDGLLVEVIDDGVGLPNHYQAGIGLTSMRERTEELGGSFTAQNQPDGGSHICALLPLAVS